MFANAIEIIEIQQLINNVENREALFSEKNNIMNDTIELKKYRTVDINSLSKNFLSVPKSFIAFINLELGKEGIKEKQLKNKAVASDENERVADISSEKLNNSFGDSFINNDNRNTKDPIVIIILFFIIILFIAAPPAS